MWIMHHASFFSEATLLEIGVYREKKIDKPLLTSRKKVKHMFIKILAGSKSSA